MSVEKLLEFNHSGWFEVDEYRGDIEIFVKNMELIDEGKPLLICFNAAVPKREFREYPFFSGLQISDELKCPLIALADPSLQLSYNLSLAWYLGNSGSMGLQRSISDFVKKISGAVDIPPVLIGGSGGGFAALATKAVDPAVGCNAVVWNPQVSVTGYYQTFVRRYVDTCFSDFLLDSPDRQVDFFEENKMVHDLCLVGSDFNGRIIYFQNKSDEMHLRKHCLRYVERSLKSSKMKDGFDVFYRGDVEVMVGDWGKGHIPPPDEVIKSSIFSFL